MKKILVVITTAFVKFGGLTNSYLNYYRYMDKKDLKIDFTSMNDPEPELREEIMKNGGEYYKLPDKRKSPLKYLHAFKKLCKGYDVVHVHGNSATMAGELVLAKHNHVKKRLAHCHTSQTKHPYMNYFLKPIFWKSYTQGIAVSKMAGDWLYKEHSYMILYNLIDTEKYRFNRDNRKVIRQQFGILDDVVLIGNVGKINPSKNHTFLLDVFKRIHEDDTQTKLLIIGDGPLKKELEKKAKDLGICDDVIFAGMISNPYEYYSAMDCFMFPSVFEGLGMVLLEAQCNGLLCLASNTVTKESNITGNVKYLNFDVDAWLDKYNEIVGLLQNAERKDRSDDAVLKMRQNGLDSILCGKKLREIYLD